MSEKTSEELSSAVVEGIRALSSLSEGDYRMNLEDLASDPHSTGEQRLVRVGRLMGVMLKQPFSEALPLDPTQSRTGAFQAWELRPKLLEDPARVATWQYALMDKLRGENNFSSVTAFAKAAYGETGFFSYLAQSFHKYVCGKPELRKKIDEAVSELERHGGSGQRLTPQALLGAAGTTIATCLVLAMPWLTVAAPILAGFVVIIGTIGLDAFCSWSSQPGLETRAEEQR